MTSATTRIVGTRMLRRLRVEALRCLIRSRRPQNLILARFLWLSPKVDAPRGTTGGNSTWPPCVEFLSMSDDERQRWNDRYATGEYRARTWPTAHLERWVPQVRTGRALVIACGPGRNALYLAEQGFDVVGVDISEVAIRQARASAADRRLAAEFFVADLDEFVPEPGSFDLITVIRYRNRDLWPRLVEALAPDGWILAEHHMKTTAEVGGPSSPDFRLDPEELLEAFAGLRIVHYSESIEPADDETRAYAIQRAVACNGEPGW